MYSPGFGTLAVTIRQISLRKMGRFFGAPFSAPRLPKSLSSPFFDTTSPFLAVGQTAAQKMALALQRNITFSNAGSHVLSSKAVVCLGLVTAALDVAAMSYGIRGVALSNNSIQSCCDSTSAEFDQNQLVHTANGTLCASASAAGLSQCAWAHNLTSELASACAPPLLADLAFTHHLSSLRLVFIAKLVFAIIGLALPFVVYDAHHSPTEPLKERRCIDLLDVLFTLAMMAWSIALFALDRGEDSASQLGCAQASASTSAAVFNHTGCALVEAACGLQYALRATDTDPLATALSITLASAFAALLKLFAKLANARLHQDGVSAIYAG